MTMPQMPQMPEITRETDQPVTSRFMSPYESTALISRRAEMLSRGALAVPGVDCSTSEPIDVARAELHAGKLDLIIRRALAPEPSGAPRYEDWHASELLLKVDGSLRPERRARLVLNETLTYAPPIA